jgi:hypothetical protein
VVAVVAAIGVATVLLRSPGQPAQEDVQVADTTTTAPPKPAGPLPGWETIPLDETSCKQTPLRNVPGKPPEAILPQALVEPAFTGAIAEVVNPAVIPLSATWEAFSPKAHGPRGHVVAEIPMGNGNGQLQLEAQVFPGTPEQIADASLYTYGDCKPPARRTLDDGTVMQLYQADVRVPEQPVQHLQVYRPEGRYYIITAAGWSEQDMVPVAGSTGFTIEGGRGKLPTTAAQLAEIAEKMVTRLG